MKMQWLIAVVAACLLPAASASAVDAVKKVDETTMVGKVTRVAKTEVEIEERSVPKTVPVNEIDHIVYEGEPITLKTVRSHVASGRYNDALDQLGRIPADEVTRKEIQQDVAFYKALCQAKLALSGEGPIADAGKLMNDFVTGNADSYHYFQAVEMVGDLLVATRKYDVAATFYARLGQEAPWPDYKMRSGASVGRSLLAQNKPQDALKAFDGVLATQAEGDLADQEKLAATLGKARCMAELGQAAEAVAMIQDVIAKAGPEDVDLAAMAYNALGSALRKAGDSKAALLAFLHVDVLYHTNGMAHAEALANMAELWNEIHQTERATEARELLQSQYKNSPWAQR